MSIYKRDAVNPEWEPVPWNARGHKADAQEKAFHERALKPIVWRKIDWERIPEGGLFGFSKEDLQSRDISWFAEHDGEELLLIDNIWFGFPDPPRWGLAWRPAGQAEAKWQHLGHFPDLPKAWCLGTNAPSL
ncbi:MAG: hypothetical protein AAF067_10285 [Pseudomonadota bacterium]